MKKLLLIACALFISHFLFAGTIETQPGKKNELKLTESTWQKVSFSLTTAEINTLLIANGGQSYTRLLMPSCSKTDVIGSPELPVRREFIEIPLGASLRVEITKAVYEDYNLAQLGFPYPVIPAQAPVAKNATEVPFVFDHNAYSRNAFTPAVLVSGEILGMMRSYRLARLDLAPVQYNPVTHTLRVYTQIEATIYFDKADIPATLDLKEKYENFYYQPIGRNILNYQPLANRDTVAKYPITYLIVSDPMFESQLQPFIQWKTQQGYTVIEGYTNDPQVGTTTNTIKNYIKNLYNNPPAGLQPPSFVLFVGDVAQIPAWNGTAGSHVTDLYYCEYDGDLFPEIYYGRFSATNASQLQPQIDKSIEYEKYTMPDPSYLSEVVMIAGVDASYGPDWANGQINYGTENYFNAEHAILSHTYLYPESGNHSADIIQNVSDGVTFANYTAHGSETGWANPSFSNSDIQTLQNEHKYGLLVGNCCLTARYDYGECFAEALLRASGKGAVGYIGGSNNSYWDEDYYFGVGVGQISEDPPSYEETTLGNYDRAWHTHGEPWEDWCITMDQHVYAGNLAVTLGSPGMADYYWEIYNTMGDPSLMVYYGLPSPMTVTYQPLMPLSTTSFTVNAVPYAYVAISVNGVLKGAALADASGVAVVPISTITNPCTADVVVTAQNKQPFFGTLIVANPEGPFILMSSSEEAELSGYTNHKNEPGEVIGITIELRNYGQSDGTDVTTTLSTTDPYVTISDAGEYCGTVPALSTKPIENAFSVIIGQDIPDGHEVEFVVNIQDPNREAWSSTMKILLSAPILKLNSLLIDDSQGGNNNGKLDAGENVVITATYANAGHAIGRNAVANLCAHSGFITIENPTYTIGNLGLFGTTPVTYNVSVDGKTPNGILVDFMVNLTAEAYALNEVHPLKVGFICEDFESGGFTSFPWSQGGNAPWTLISTYPYEGFYSSHSGAIGNSQTSELILNYQVMQGDSISFYKKVSCAPGDSLRFYVDGVKKGSWSGTTSGWKRVVYYIAPGNHVFKWAYMKDGNGSGGSDAAWLDYIILPPSLATTLYAGEDDLLCAGNPFPCQGEATNYQSVTWNTSGTGSFDNTAALSAQYTPSTEDIANGSVTLSLNVLDVTGDAFSDDMLLTFTDIPARPAIPTGPDYVLIDNTYISAYTMDPVMNATSCDWVIEPAEAGMFSCSGNTGTVVWDRNFAGTAYISVTARNDCGAGITSENLAVTVENSTVGIGAPVIAPFALSVYPNPVSEVLTITCNGENMGNLQISLVDMMGKTVATCKGPDRTNLSVKDLAPGMYILVAKTATNQVTRKIIVR
jgi:hypothetical protein